MELVNRISVKKNAVYFYAKKKCSRDTKGENRKHGTEESPQYNPTKLN